MKKSQKILWLDHEVYLRPFAERVFHDLGYEVILTKDLKEASDALDSGLVGTVVVEPQEFAEQSLQPVLEAAAEQGLHIRAYTTVSSDITDSELKHLWEKEYLKCGSGDTGLKMDLAHDMWRAEKAMKY